MRTIMFESNGRQHGITTASLGVGYSGSWHCFTCGAEAEVPGLFQSREQAQQRAESLADSHMCVEVAADA